MGVPVAVGVCVGVFVGVLVAVAVSVYMGVRVGVFVGTDVRSELLLLSTWGRWTVRDGVGVKAACGAVRAPSRSTDTMSRKIARTDTAPTRRPTTWLGLIFMR
jgi:hypothetical protein